VIEDHSQYRQKIGHDDYDYDDVAFVCSVSLQLVVLSAQMLAAASRKTKYAVFVWMTGRANNECIVIAPSVLIVKGTGLYR